MATATVQVKTYRKAANVPSPSDRDDRVFERQALYGQAGLKKLAQLTPQHADAGDRLASAGLLYGELTAADLVVWRRYLPTSYKRYGYSYDVPPEEVALAIIDADVLKLFDQIEIWTSEGSDVKERVGRFYRRASHRAHEMLEVARDPMAVGVISLGGTEHYFPIVRWGKALHSFGRIKATVWARSLAVFALTKLPLILLAIAVLGLLVWGFAATWTAVGARALLYWSLGAFITAWVFAGVW